MNLACCHWVGFENLGFELFSFFDELCLIWDSLGFDWGCRFGFSSDLGLGLFRALVTSVGVVFSTGQKTTTHKHRFLGRCLSVNSFSLVYFFSVLLYHVVSFFLFHFSKKKREVYRHTNEMC